MAGRFLQRLEQRILGRDAERLGVVDNRHAPCAAAWPRAQPRDQLAHLLNQHLASAFGARKAGEVRMHPARDLHARRATLASRRRARARCGAASTSRFSRLAHRAILHPATEAGTGRAFAQERMREAARYHRLAHPAWARQQVGVRRTGEKFGVQPLNRFAIAAHAVERHQWPTNRSTAIKISVLTVASSRVESMTVTRAGSARAIVMKPSRTRRWNSTCSPSKRS